MKKEAQHKVDDIKDKVKKGFERESLSVERKIIEPVEEKARNLRDKAKNVGQNIRRNSVDYEERAKESVENKIHEIKEKSGEFFDSAYENRERNALNRASKVQHEEKLPPQQKIQKREEKQEPLTDTFGKQYTPDKEIPRGEDLLIRPKDFYTEKKEFERRTHDIYDRLDDIAHKERNEIEQQTWYDKQHLRTN